MEPGAEGRPRIERDRDRVGGARVGPGGTDEESADAHRGDRRLPRLEPVLILDGADRKLSDRTEAERLKVTERIARVRDLRE